MYVVKSTDKTLFNGKPEVIYALNKAAVCSKVITRMKQSIYTVDRSVQCKHEALRDAYIDMACFDSSFLDTINNISIDELKTLKKLLKSFKTARSGLIRPLTDFEIILRKTFKTKYIADSAGMDIINKFIYKLSNSKKGMV